MMASRMCIMRLCQTRLHIQPFERLNCVRESRAISCVSCKPDASAADPVVRPIGWFVQLMGCRQIEDIFGI